MSRSASPPSAASVTAVSTLIWAEDVYRLPTWIHNTHASATCYLTLGASAATVAAGWPLGPGQSVLIDTASALRGISDGSDISLRLWPGLISVVAPGSGDGSAAVDTFPGIDDRPSVVLTDADSRVFHGALKIKSRAAATAGNTVSAKVAHANPKRRSLSVRASTANTVAVWIAFDTPAVSGNGVPLYPGDVVDYQPGECPIGALYGLASAASQALWIEEGE